MKTEEALIYLASCVVNKTTPDSLQLQSVDIQELLKLAEKHQMYAVAAYGLKQANKSNESVMQEYYHLIYIDKLFDTERDTILDQLEKHHIWYLPLKGVILKKYYPQPFLRQMSDNDILFDSDRANDVHDIMISLGYETAIFESGHRDDYHKPPVHFEMHRVLFADGFPHDSFIDYFKDIRRIMIKDQGNQYGYHRSEEDFYIYRIAHEYTHYVWMGTGLRSLLDQYVFLNQFSNKLDWNYIKKEIKKLGISKYEKCSRGLAMKAFSPDNIEQLNAKEKKELNYYIESGAYGLTDNYLTGYIRQVGKKRFIMTRFFIPMKKIKEHYPFFYKYKVLIPFLSVYRLIKQRKNAINEIKQIHKI